MATLDQTLDIIIPWAVGIIGVWILYRPLREPLAPLVRGVGNFFRWIGRKISGEEEMDINEFQNLRYE